MLWSGCTLCSVYNKLFRIVILRMNIPFDIQNWITVNLNSIYKLKILSCWYDKKVFHQVFLLPSLYVHRVVWMSLIQRMIDVENCIESCMVFRSPKPVSLIYLVQLLAGIRVAYVTRENKKISCFALRRSDWQMIRRINLIAHRIKVNVRKYSFYAKIRIANIIMGHYFTIS